MGGGQGWQVVGSAGVARKLPLVRDPVQGRLDGLAQPPSGQAGQQIRLLVGLCGCSATAAGSRVTEKAGGDVGRSSAAASHAHPAILYHIGTPHAAALQPPMRIISGVPGERRSPSILYYIIMRRKLCLAQTTPYELAPGIQEHAACRLNARRKTNA